MALSKSYILVFFVLFIGCKIPILPQNVQEEIYSANVPSTGLTTLEFIEKSNRFVYYGRDSSFYSGGVYGFTAYGNIWYESDSLLKVIGNDSYYIMFLYDTVKIVDLHKIIFRDLLLTKS